MAALCWMSASSSLHLSFASLFFFFNSFLRLPLSTSFSVSSLVAVPCWGESNLNYVSQGPIPLLPAVGISDLLISYQPVIGLRSPSPSDIPQIYDTPDSLRGGWGGGGGGGWGCWGVPPACLTANTLLNKMSSWPHIDANFCPHLSSCRGIFQRKIIQSFKLYSRQEVQQDFMLCVNYEHPFLPFSHSNKLWNCNQSFKWKWCGLPRKKLI